MTRGESRTEKHERALSRPSPEVRAAVEDAERRGLLVVWTAGEPTITDRPVGRSSIWSCRP